MTLLILAFLTVFLVTMAVVRFSHTHAHLTNDHDLAGVQKFHSNPVPRVGGLGIVCAVVVGAGLLHWRYPSVGAAPGCWWLAGCRRFCRGSPRM